MLPRYCCPATIEGERPAIWRLDEGERFPTDPAVHREGDALNGRDRDCCIDSVSPFLENVRPRQVRQPGLACDGRLATECQSAMLLVGVVRGGRELAHRFLRGHGSGAGTIALTSERMPHAPAPTTR